LYQAIAVIQSYLALVCIIESVRPVDESFSFVLPRFAAFCDAMLALAVRHVFRRRFFPSYASCFKVIKSTSHRCRQDSRRNSPMPPAARITDMHVCPRFEGIKPHVGGPIVTGASTVMIGFIPAARVNDTAICVGPPDSIAIGSPTVFIERKMAARIGDTTAHGGAVVAGFPTVNIGVTPQMNTLLVAAQFGIPFCEECAPGELSDVTETP
jgi:uncharacterized Zn-binding protein involved in type VI secretion